APSGFGGWLVHFDGTYHDWPLSRRLSYGLGTRMATARRRIGEPRNAGLSVADACLLSLLPGEGGTWLLNLEWSNLVGGMKDDRDDDKPPLRVRRSGEALFFHSRRDAADLRCVGGRVRSPQGCQQRAWQTSLGSSPGIEMAVPRGLCQAPLSDIYIDLTQ